MSGSRSRPLAVGVAAFAAVMLLVTSVLQLLQGLAAVLTDEVFASGSEYVYRLDLTTWGWVHLVLGALGAAVAFGILGGRSWALAAGIGLAGLGAVTQFVFLPYYPFWAVLLIAMFVLVIWALCEQIRDAR